MNKQNRIEVLHEQAMKYAKEFLKSEKNLLSVLEEIDRLKAFRDLGFSSTFAYATKALKLSDAVAYTLITVARASQKSISYKEAIESGALSITNARIIAPIISELSKKNSSDVSDESINNWVKEGSISSKRELERKVVKEFPLRSVREQIKPVSNNRLELKLGISEALESNFKRAQDLVSQKLGRSTTFEETLEFMTMEFLNRNDAVLKAERVEKAQKVRALERSKAKVIETQNFITSIEKKEAVNQEPLHSEITEKPRNKKQLFPGRVPIPAALKHAVNLRDQGQCTQIENGTRCESKRFIEIHHVIPVSEGGQNNLTNLRTLCFHHHRMIHEPLFLLLESLGAMPLRAHHQLEDRNSIQI